MRVTLCVDSLNRQLSGIGRYTWELCTRLPRHKDIADIRFFGRGSFIHDPAILRREPRPQWYWRQLWRLTGPIAKAMLRSGLVHGPNYFLPRQAETGVITVHDLSVFRFPQSHPASRVTAFELQFASSLARASHVITDSETVRRELIEEFSISPDRVSAVPLGTGEGFRPMAAAELKLVLRQWDLQPGGYGLSVATIEPRKKIGELISAWSKLPPRVRSRFPLVLAGALGWCNEELRERIARGVSEGWVKNLGFVREPDLPKLFAGARLFVYPSIYEGFGLPPIEAMASGVPVIVSDRSCLPEVCGDAARFINPDEEDEFVRAIEECLCDDRWCMATIERGLERAAQFTWDRCIEGTIKAYKKASAELPPGR